jgi:hypothetical protein
VTYAGKPAFTQFSASNGGWTAAGSQPYLTARADPYDGVHPSTAHDWTQSISISTLQSKATGTGTFRRLEITSRDGHGDWGGRTVKVTVVGSTGSTTVSGNTFRGWFGLRSEWFVVTSAPLVASPAFPRDLSDDGDADLTAVDSAGRLRVFRGDGTGGFAAPLLTGAGWQTLSQLTATGPLDADNRGDLVGRRADGSVWLYPGSSTGAFVQTPRLVATGWNGYDQVLAPGDWDGDGHHDLMVRSASTGALLLVRGVGDGSLRAPQHVNSGWQSMREVFATGDFTGDGAPDLLAVRADTRVMYVYPGNGRGGWGTPAVVTAGWSGFDAWLGPGDITGDGRADVVARRTADGALLLYPGTGAGKVQPPQLLLTGWGSYPTLVP